VLLLALSLALIRVLNQVSQASLIPDPVLSKRGAEQYIKPQFYFGVVNLDTMKVDKYIINLFTMKEEDYNIVHFDTMQEDEYIMLESTYSEG
jgi:hypothetical protein